MYVCTIDLDIIKNSLQLRTFRLWIGLLECLKKSNFINCMVPPWKCLRKSVPWLIVSWMTKAYGETQLFSHSETLGSSSHLLPLHYFQGTTFCILAETKLSIRIQHLREHVLSSSRHFKPTEEAVHLKNRRYKKQCSLAHVEDYF